MLIEIDLAEDHLIQIRFDLVEHKDHDYHYM